MPEVDPLTALLDGVRSHGAGLGHVDLTGPGTHQVHTPGLLTMVVPLNGSLLITGPGLEPVSLQTDDVAVLAHSGPASLSTPRAQTAQRALIGSWTVEKGLPARLKNTLPPVLVIDANTGSCPVSPDVMAEIGRAQAGQQALIDRVLDLMLVTALRAWLIDPATQAPAWYLAHLDPVVGPAVSLLHDRPADPWTVESLAHATGVSRATLARRFAHITGETPMAHLRDHRLTLAAHLVDEGMPLSAIAERVGFASPYSLSAAFTKHHGLSPRAHRRRP